MTTPFVEFRGITKSFGAHRAVDGVSLQVQRGEFFSLLGPSGCGKTTTLRLLAGLEAPDAGEILLEGLPIAHLPAWERPLSMVFQSYALFPHLSVAQNVAFGLEQRKRPATEIAERVRKALDLVRLAPETFATRMPSQLSGGQRQRVALARALVVEPSILLLDEPLGALDLQLRKEMQLELRALNRQLGITFVYVTHDQEEALTLSDRIAVMAEARVVQVGRPAEIYEDPRTEFVARFVGEVNVLSGPVGQRAGGPGEKIAIRPEWMDLFSPGRVPAGEHSLDGRVQGIVYLGETLHVLVEIAGGQVLKVALRNEGQLTNPISWKAGDAVAVAWRLALPGLGWLLLFAGVPLLLVAGYSVMPRGLYGGVERGFTLAPYAQLLDPLYLGIIGRTLFLSAIATAGCLLIGFPMAYVIARSGRWRRVLLFLVVLPFWTSFLVRTYAVIFLLRDTGLINSALLSLGITNAPLTLLYTPGAVLAGLIYGFLPFAVLPIYASLEKLDPTLLEAAEMLGARPATRFWRVTLPLAMPGVVAGALLVFIPALGSFLTPDLLGGAKTTLLGNLVQNQFTTGRDWPFGSAASMLLLVGTFIALMWHLRRSEESSAPSDGRAP